MDFTAIIGELGIGKLTEEQQKPIFESIIRTLKMRVGYRLATELTDEQLEQLAEASRDGNETAALQELERLYPNIQQVYREELATIKDNINALL